MNNYQYNNNNDNFNQVNNYNNFQNNQGNDYGMEQSQNTKQFKPSVKVSNNPGGRSNFSLGNEDISQPQINVFTYDPKKKR